MRMVNVITAEVFIPQTFEDVIERLAEHWHVHLVEHNGRWRPVSFSTSIADLCMYTDHLPSRPREEEPRMAMYEVLQYERAVSEGWVEADIRSIFRLTLIHPFRLVRGVEWLYMYKTNRIGLYHEYVTGFLSRLNKDGDA